MKLKIERRCGHYEMVTRYGGHYDEQVEQLERGLCLNCWKAKQPAEQPVAYCRMTNQGIEIDVVHAYAIKDSLKAKGYRWYPDYMVTGNNCADIMRKPDGAWQRFLPLALMAEERTEAEKQTILSEAEWLKSLGCKIEIRSMVAGMVASVMEGRPDLIPA